MSPRRALLAALATAVLAAPRAARAVDRFEIQVYESDINEPGQPGLEVHLNGTLRGTRTPEYSGQIPPYRVGRITFEPAVGVTDFLELGAYLQFLWAPGGDQRFGGAKLRTKWVVPERLSGAWMLGLNVEVSAVPHAVESDRWASELRPIVGWRGDRLMLSVNPIVGVALTGGDRFRPDLEPCGKISWDTRLGVAAGVEYFTSLGFANDLLPASEQEHLLFAVVDLVPEKGPLSPTSPAHESPWELNVGFGGALTSAPGPHLLVKAIVGRSF
jgi:hypothetical protein